MEKRNSFSREFCASGVERFSILDSSVKVVTIVGLIILGIIIDLGGERPPRIL
jgi:hypothetical protein